ncbi:MAG: hypothetical protein AAF317_21485 [Pseudomonadota bacterium]
MRSTLTTGPNFRDHLSFRNDTERLERLFKLYAARIEKLKKEEAA